MKIQRRKFIKLGFLSALLTSFSWPLRVLGFSAARLRRRNRRGPLRTTQIMMVLSALINTKTARTTQVMLVASGNSI